GCADVLRHIHLHAVHDGEEIRALQVEMFDRSRVVGEPRRRLPAIERVDVVAPLLQRREPLAARPVGIGDVVDLATEAVDLEHRLALLGGQDAHRGVERAAGCGRAVIGARGRFQRHAPATDLETGCWPAARRAVSAATAASVKASNSPLPRCTRSLRGSRTLSMRTILSAKAWMTAISSPRRKS